MEGFLRECQSMIPVKNGVKIIHIKREEVRM
nr:MAG TPA: hypothetical protein [Caudoviricetes sp.]